jgi:hypothetical protein
MHHDVASPYIKNSPYDLMELHTEPSPMPRQFEATQAPPSGQGAPSEPPEAAQPLSLDRRRPEQATASSIKVEKKDVAASPSCRLPDSEKPPISIPSVAAPF